MMAKTILVIDDESQIVEICRDYLHSAGFDVLTARDGPTGLAITHRRHPDLIVLDLMLPGMDGLDVCRTLRREGNTPIIILTARVEETDKLIGLELGADDYLTKPFSFSELLARIQAILRRGKGESPSEKLKVANLVLEPDGHRVFRENSKIELTPREYALLEFFVRRQGQIITRTMISERIFDYHFDTSTNVVDVHVSHLRSKIDKDFEPKLLHTVKGVGYVLEDRG